MSLFLLTYLIDTPLLNHPLLSEECNFSLNTHDIKFLKTIKNRKEVLAVAQRLGYVQDLSVTSLASYIKIKSNSCR